MHEKRLIQLRDVSAKTGLRRSAIYDRMKRKDFPLAVKLGSSSRWVLSEVEAWIDTQIVLRDQQLSASSGYRPGHRRSATQGEL